MNIKKILLYLGGTTILAALLWLMVSAASIFQSASIFTLGLIYLCLFLFVANFLYKKEQKIPSCILYIISVCLVPLVFWSLFDILGTTTNNINSLIVRITLIITELATAALCIILLKKKDFAVITIPCCISLWCFAMDIAPFLTGQIKEPTLEIRKFATFIFAVIILFLARILDKKQIKNYGNWLYNIAASALWALLIWAFSTSFSGEFGEFGEFLLAFFAFEYIILSIMLKRKVFVLWGIIGIFGYIAHLGLLVFDNPLTFPILLILLGTLIILTGIYYDKYYDKIDSILGKYISME